MTGRRCEVGGMVSCRLNVSWVLPSYVTSSCMSHFGYRDPLPECIFLLHVRTGLLTGVPRRHQCGRDRRRRGTRRTGNPLPLEVTRRRMGTQDGPSGTLAAPFPAARRIKQRHGRRPRKIFCILHWDERLKHKLLHEGVLALITCCRTENHPRRSPSHHKRS